MTEQTFKDRSGALIAMGVCEILGGVLMALFTVLMVVGFLMMSIDQPATQLIFPFLLYAALSAWLFIMGIGTLRAKRWARVLMLVASIWSLVVGLAASVFMVFFIPKLLSSPELAGSSGFVVAIFTGLILGLLYLVLPAVGIVFYTGKNVRATCEHRNPTPCWADRCPLPVLIISLMMLLVPASLLSQLASNYVFPFFGTLLSGIPGAFLWILSSLLGLALGIGLYKLKPAAWWGTLIYYSIFSVSNVLTFSRISMTDFYRAANYSEEMMQQISQSGWMMDESWMVTASLAFTLPVLIYLLFIQRYFTLPEPKEQQHEQSD